MQALVLKVLKSRTGTRNAHTLGRTTAAGYTMRDLAVRVRRSAGV